MDADLLMHPDRRLLTACKPVDGEFIASGELARLLIAMKTTLAGEGTGIGLAANQLGADRRVIVIALDGAEHVLLNPVIEQQSGRVRVTERCLSVRKDGVMVPYRVLRPKRVRVRYSLPEIVKGSLRVRRTVLTASGLLAQCIAHEMDHLNGLSLVERGRRIA